MSDNHKDTENILFSFWIIIQIMMMINEMKTEIEV